MEGSMNEPFVLRADVSAQVYPVIRDLIHKEFDLKLRESVPTIINWYSNPHPSLSFDLAEVIGALLMLDRLFTKPGLFSDFGSSGDGERYRAVIEALNGLRSLKTLMPGNGQVKKWVVAILIYDSQLRIAEGTAIPQDQLDLLT